MKENTHSTPSGESIAWHEDAAFRAKVKAIFSADRADFEAEFERLSDFIEARRATSERSEEKPACTTLPSRLESWEKTVHVPQGGRAFRVPPEIAEEVERLRAELKIAGTTAAAPNGDTYFDSEEFRAVLSDYTTGNMTEFQFIEHIKDQSATAGNAASTDLRVSFEESHPKMNLARGNDGKYISGWTQIAWEGWQELATPAATAAPTKQKDS